MASRARKMRSDEDGFIIIEVLVSALILAIVAGAVLTLITATTRGAAVQRDRAVAYDLAQSDQARLRTLKLTEISGIKVETKTPAPVIDGTEYEVRSERVFDNNGLGATACASASVKADYVQMTSTVSSNTMLKPVVLQSVVSPSSGSLDENNGTLTAHTLNAEGKALSGVTVTATSSGAGTRSAKTGAEGCTNFVSVPAGSYNVIYNGNGLINTKGEFETTANPEVVSLAAGEYKSTATTSWDHPATLEPQFVYLEPGTGVLRLAPVDSMTVANATNGVSLPVGTPGVRAAASSTKAVFPFKSPGAYTVYAGSCTTNNPGTTGANATGIYSAVLAPNAKPLGIQIHVPALEVTVTERERGDRRRGQSDGDRLEQRLQERRQQHQTHLLDELGRAPCGRTGENETDRSGDRSRPAVRHLRDLRVAESRHRIPEHLGDRGQGRKLHLHRHHAGAQTRESGQRMHLRARPRPRCRGRHQHGRSDGRPGDGHGRAGRPGDAADRHRARQRPDRRPRPKPATTPG